MTEMKELTTLKGQISKIENQAQAVIIATKEDYANAADLVSKLKDIGSRIKSQKESITKPLNEALRNARELFAPIELQYLEAEGIIKSKILEYKVKKDAEAKAEETKIVGQIESGYIKIETAESKMGVIERVGSTTRGEVGEIQIRKIRKVRIVDEMALPRKYLIPDNVAIRRDALGGKEIPGVEVYDEEQVAVGKY